ncbi:MAG: glycoside hydrolase family 16 protein [Chitinophagaceae bacterium]
MITQPSCFFTLLFIVALPFNKQAGKTAPAFAENNKEMVSEALLASAREKIDSQPKRRLVWADDFDSTGIPDQTKWSYETGYIRNSEQQYYTGSRPENARLENGLLVIEARNDSLKPGNNTFAVTSASITTEGKASWTYGRIEVKAKIPSSLGSWPAIWMLGTDHKTVGWPACGEIDIMENVGFDPEKIHTNIHTKAYNHVLKTNKGKATPISQPHHNFHVYAIEWSKTAIDFFIDEQKVFSYRNEATGEDTWPFDKPFYLILNLAIGGSWGAQKGVDLKQLPQQFLVDYVRVYQ